jgi:hypothetical protein
MTRNASTKSFDLMSRLLLAGKMEIEPLPSSQGGTLGLKFLDFQNTFSYWLSMKQKPKAFVKSKKEREVRPKDVWWKLSIFQVP